jgi:putative hydrolase of the HAD superfamily
MPRRQRRIRAVLFDLGGTLITFHHKANSYWLFRAAARRSYVFLKRTGQPVGNFAFYFWRNFTSLRLRYVLARLAGKDFDSLALFKKVGAKRGVRLTDGQWEQFAWLWYEPLKKAATVEPDIVRTLSNLRDAGLKLGLVSNTFVNALSLDKHLAEIGILDLLPVRVYSYNLPFRKPDPRIFQSAVGRAGCECAEAVFVGDEINTDIKGALAAGMHAVLKATSDNTRQKLPAGVFRITSLTELPALIEKIDTALQEQDKLIGPSHR